jgi:hypothetical protein
MPWLNLRRNGVRTNAIRKAAAEVMTMPVIRSGG